MEKWGVKRGAFWGEKYFRTKKKVGKTGKNFDPPLNRSKIATPFQIRHSRESTKKGREYFLEKVSHCTLTGVISTWDTHVPSGLTSWKRRFWTARAPKPPPPEYEPLRGPYSLRVHALKNTPPPTGSISPKKRMECINWSVIKCTCVFVLVSFGCWVGKGGWVCGGVGCECMGWCMCGKLTQGQDWQDDDDLVVQCLFPEVQWSAWVNTVTNH